MIPTTENTADVELSLAVQIPRLKKAVNEQVKLIYLDKWNEKTKQLVAQGDFLQLLISEKSNVTWKSIIYGVPKGVMEFALRSSTNTLATPDNLKRWKRGRSDLCQMCIGKSNFPHKATLFHILNNCAGFLGDEERMTWRHNSILSYIASTLDVRKPAGIQIYSDLPDLNINGGSIPPNIMVTTSRPDLVIVDTSAVPHTIYLYELTVCFEKEGNFEAANLRKRSRYEALASDLKEKGYNVCNIPFEIGSRGHLSRDTKINLSLIHKLCKAPVKFNKFCENISKTSLLCSYAIYLSRNEPWTKTSLLSPA